MNERVRELYKQSGMKFYRSSGNSFDIREFNPEKFAELLLQECMTICGAIQGAAEYKNMQDFAAGAAKCKEIIKQNFGVK